MEEGEISAEKLVKDIIPHFSRHPFSTRLYPRRHKRDVGQAPDDRERYQENGVGGQRTRLVPANAGIDDLFRDQWSKSLIEACNDFPQYEDHQPVHPVAHHILHEQLERSPETGGVSCTVSA
ncbi:MAG: hypothetical protein M1396_02720 [Chloroflexi bacterium]|nr:hypothetical protein [Chloroflexota bacterium]